jgi:hypothetical protein
VRSVEGYSNNLYVGSTDGQVEWWIYDGSAGTSDVSNVDVSADIRTAGGSCRTG